VAHEDAAVDVLALAVMLASSGDARNATAFARLAVPAAFAYQGHQFNCHGRPTKHW
jgi:hypothetical protein